MEPVRVLHVVGRMDRGGIETLIMNLYRNVDRTKVQFDFLCHYGREADYNEEIRSLGGRIYEMPVIKSTTKTYYHKVFQYIRALDSFFKEHKEFKVIHGHMTNTASIYMPIAKKYGIDCRIAHSHLNRARKGLSGVITNILQLSINRVATDYFSCSNKAAEWLFSHNAINSDKFKIINNAIDTNAFRFNQSTREEIRNKFNLKNKTVIGHVGRFYYEKNHEFLLKIFNSILNNNPASVLMLIGDGVLKDSIEERVKELKIEDNVLFLGSRDDVNKLMQAMDVFVMPSHFEGLPVVGVEAQASGLPCFFSDNLTKELDITGNVNYLSLNKGPSEWATEILNLTMNFKRTDTTRLVVENGYDISSTAKWIQDFYINHS
ncbi:glycosyltransferase family 1 protein [Ureibacillus chungkukjangi]|uniref:glycosyltransferase family 1 protein n=1 Tax=Ureibacillus chungkukjangi TaxID=1202712 RepID=UPI00203E2FAD|nr:glycosyltransferase family 1 protein [Ureibacillus chungkukjangi]MCM3386843.1 glycosyltransferase family 1 protein [Ureibacillus chungkukjangi]